MLQVCILPWDGRVEYFMIKRSIILLRSRPRLRLNEGRGAQITVQAPSQQRKEAELRRGRAVREGPSHLG